MTCQTQGGYPKWQAQCLTNHTTVWMTVNGKFIPGYYLYCKVYIFFFASAYYYYLNTQKAITRNFQLHLTIIMLQNTPKYQHILYDENKMTRVVMYLTFVDSDYEGVRSWGDEPTVAINQISHVFCCSQGCCGDCERLHTRAHTERLVWEQDRELLHSGTMRALWRITSSARAHIHSQTLHRYSAMMHTCFSTSASLLQTHTHSPDTLMLTFKFRWQQQPPCGASFFPLPSFYAILNLCNLKCNIHKVDKKNGVGLIWWVNEFMSYMSLWFIIGLKEHLFWWQ